MHLKPGTIAMTVLLAFMTAMGPVTMDIYLASMPHIGDSLGASAGAVQLTLSFYVIGFAIGQIFYGPLSDIYGRRPMLFVAFALYLLASSICALSTSIEMLMIARLAQAIGAAGPIILARAIVRDLYAGARAAKQLGLMASIMGVTPIGAPVLGGFLQAWFGWRASFVSMAVFGLAVAVCALLFLPETNKHKSESAPSLSLFSILRSYNIVARNKAYLSYLAMMVITYAGVFAFISGSSHVLQDVYGLTSVEFGFTFGLCSMSYIVGTFIGTRLGPRRGLEGMIGLGMKYLLAGGLLPLLGYWIFPDQFLAIILPQALFYLGNGFMIPQLMAGALTPFPDRAGTASSLMGVTQMTSAALVGAIMGAMLERTAWPLLIVMALSAIAAFAVFQTTVSIRRRAMEALATQSHTPSA